MERWLPVLGFEGLYEVSDCAQVRSLRRHKVLRPSPSSCSPYLKVTLYRGKGRGSVTQPLHILVAAAFLGPRPEGLMARHLDNNPMHNHLRNLEYGTRSENHADRRRALAQAGR